MGAPLHTLSKFKDVSVGFVPPSHLRQCFALFVVAEGWLLLDIVWFVLFLWQMEKLSHSKSEKSIKVSYFTTSSQSQISFALWICCVVLVICAQYNRVPGRIYIYTQTKVKQHHIFSETLFWKLQNGIYGKWKSNIFNFTVNFITFMSTLS